MGYRVVVEQTPNNYSAYSPDYPGVGVAGATEQDVRKLLAEAIEIWEEEELKDAEQDAERAATLSREAASG